MSKLKKSQQNRNAKCNKRAPYKVEHYKKHGSDTDTEFSHFESEEDACDREQKLPSVGSYISPAAGKQIVKYEGNQNGDFEMFMHESKFLAEIRELWKKGQMCDIALSVEKTTFRVHKVENPSSRYITDE